MTGDPDVVRVADAKRAGYCIKGTRNWVENESDYTWQEFCQNGIPVAELEKVNHAVVQHILKVKRGG